MFNILISILQSHPLPLYPIHCIHKTSSCFSARMIHAPYLHPSTLACSLRSKVEVLLFPFLKALKPRKIYLAPPNLYIRKALSRPYVHLIIKIAHKDPTVIASLLFLRCTRFRIHQTAPESLEPSLACTNLHLFRVQNQAVF